MTERKLTKRELDPLTITRAQMAMARAACHWSMRDLAAMIGCSANGIAKYEKQGVGLGLGKLAKARELFDSDRWLACALWKLLNEAGIYPDSQALIRAGNEASNA